MKTLLSEYASLAALARSLFVGRGLSNAFDQVQKLNDDKTNSHDTAPHRFGVEKFIRRNLIDSGPFDTLL